MTKLDKFILHVPILGLMYMMVVLGDRHENQIVPTREEIKWPGIIQIATLAIIFIAAIIFN